MSMRSVRVTVLAHELSGVLITDDDRPYRWVIQTEVPPDVAEDLPPGQSVQLVLSYLGGTSRAIGYLDDAPPDPGGHVLIQGTGDLEPWPTG